MKVIYILTVALAAAVFGGCGGRTQAERGVGAERTEVTRADKSFVHDMTIANMSEIELAKLAPERSMDSEVQKFAQMMVQDHTRALNALKAIADKYSVPVPNALDDRRARQHDKLAGLRGADFDREYLDGMVDMHEDILDKLESRVDAKTLGEYKAEMADRVAGRRTAESGQVVTILPEHSDNAVTMSLNEWAAAAYPTIQAHLEQAKLLKTAMTSRAGAAH